MVSAFIHLQDPPMLRSFIASPAGSASWSASVSPRRRLPALLVVLSCCLAAAAAQPALPSSPPWAITITSVPPNGAGGQSWGTIAGQVSGGPLTGLRLAIYAHTADLQISGIG
jgi:hypothetical protein